MATTPTWRNVRPESPCPVCDHSDWCSISEDGLIVLCRRAEAHPGALEPKEDKCGQAYWVFHRKEDGSWHPGGGKRIHEYPAPEQAVDQDTRTWYSHPRASDEDCTAAYEAFLAACTVGTAHQQHLHDDDVPGGRRLTWDQIQMLGYKSYPTDLDARKAAVRAGLQAVLTDKPKDLREVYERILRIPGFWGTHRGDATVGGKPSPQYGIEFGIADQPGILLPVRDFARRVIALQLRLDHPRESGARYRSPTSPRKLDANDKSGAAMGTHCHVPLHPDDMGHSVVGITEGVIKADVATLRSGVLYLGVPSVGAWKTALPGLEQLHPQIVRIAFDADSRRKAQVGGALTSLATELSSRGYQIEVQSWPEEAGKGIDDVLTAGHQDQILTLSGKVVWEKIADLRRSCRILKPHQGVEARKTLADVVVRTKSDPTYPFDPTIKAAIGVLDESTREFQKLANDMEGALGKGRWKTLFLDVRKHARSVADAPAEQRAGRVQAPEYVIDEGCTCVKQVAADGTPMLRRLARFTAFITSEQTHDDGAECAKWLRVEGALPDGSPLRVVEIKASDFLDPTWVIESWGSAAIVEAGRDTWAHTTVAIRSTSSPRQGHVYTHTGWREFDGRWAYLFPGGCVGVSDVDVRVPGSARWGLPPPPADVDALRSAVRDSLAMLDVGADHVTVPVWGAVYTAPLASFLSVDFGIHIRGDSGNYKSGIAALAESHYGNFDYNNLPGSWLSTANNLESLLFRMKDALVVVDNLVPGADSREQREQSAKANRIGQQVGDRSARGRNDRNNEERASRPPRALMISTEEASPASPTASLAGRQIVVRVANGDVLLPELIKVSRRASSFPLALRGFLEHVCGHLESGSCTPADLPRERDELAVTYAQEIINGLDCHPRTARNLATLACGVGFFLDFARAIGVLDAAEAEVLRQRCSRALRTVAQAQAPAGEARSPVEKYLSALRAILVQGRADLANVGQELDKAGVGWLDVDHVYVVPELAWGAVQDFVGGPAHWPYQPADVHRALIEHGYVIRLQHGPDAQRRHTSEVRVLPGKRKGRVLAFRREVLADCIRSDATVRCDVRDSLSGDAEVPGMTVEQCLPN